ncbi:hypothetical protein ZWY2020_049537 [Hordeum vulgare]|nr:hypothetical protein ZWY2020_049537 [Hordeum vulgare]
MMLPTAMALEMKRLMEACLTLQAMVVNAGSKAAVDGNVADQPPPLMDAPTAWQLTQPAGLAPRAAYGPMARRSTLTGRRGCACGIAPPVDDLSPTALHADPATTTQDAVPTSTPAALPDLHGHLTSPSWDASGETPCTSPSTAPLGNDDLGCPSPAAQEPRSILRRPTPASPSQSMPHSTPASHATLVRSAGRLATPPSTLRCARQPASVSSLTLGDFLTAATKQTCSALPNSGWKRHRQPLNFSLRRGRSAAAVKAKPGVPPTAERRAQVQILRIHGIISTDQVISAEAMKAYDGVFAAPLSHAVLKAIAALVGRALPADTSTMPVTTVISGNPIEA